MLILIYCPTSVGGIPEHANYQARALSERSKEVSGEKTVMLCDEMFLLGRQVGYKKVELFNSRFVVFGRFAARFGTLVDKSLKIIADQWCLAWEVVMRRPDVVLLASYSEYLAPLWFLPHWILARFFGVVYVANLHDPVRDYVVGPRWWHELSGAMAYWPISVGVVHQRLPEPSPVPKHVQVVEAPVGVYDLQEAAVDPELIRAGWGVGKHKAQTRKEDLTTEFTESTEGEMEQPKVGPKGEGAGATESKGEARLRPGSQAGASESDSLASKLADSPVSESLTRSASIPADSGDLKLNSYKLKTPSPEVVFLAFGFIRDNKNLDLVIRALVENPEALLVVMGKAQSKKDKPVDFYRNLARELGVSDRVRFFDEFVPDEKLASYFAAADVVLLTYDKTFHSQSGVLNVAARARRRVLASAGESPLKDCVQKFKLGVFVEPDDLDALKIGMKMVARGESQEAIDSPDWEGYEAFASWDENVAKILEAVEKVKH